MWQDKLLMMCSILFGYSVIPQIIKNFKNKCAHQISWQLCIVTIFALFLSIIGMSCMKLYFTTSANTFQVICWSIVIFQKIFYRRQK